MSWQIFVIVNLLTASMLVPLQRLLLRRDETSPLSFVVMSQLLTGFVLVPICLLYGFKLPDLSKYGFLIIIMTVLYCFGHYLYAYTLKNVEASVFSTLLNTNVVWVVAMGYVILNERVYLADLIGSIIILLSVFLLMKPKTNKARLEKSIFMGLVVGTIFGIALSIWVYIGKDSDVLSWTTLSFFSTPIVFLLIRPRIIFESKNLFSIRIFPKMLLLAFIWAIDNLSALAAYQYGSASVIAPLLQSSVILSVIISVIFLNERSNIFKKVSASTICVIGVVLILSF